MQMCFLFYFCLFLTVSQKNAWRGNGRSGTAVFRDNLVAIYTHDRRLWIWTSMDISMDIHGKSVDMDMDGKFHIHGKPEFLQPCRSVPVAGCPR